MENTKISRRQSLFAGGAALAIATVAGSSVALAAGSLEENKEIALGLSRAIMAGDWGKVDMMISEDFQYEVDGRSAIGKQEYIGFMRHALASAMTDMEMDFMRVIAEGDLVAVDYTNKMTHSGEFFGIPATGKRVVATGQFIREVKDGQVINEWQTTNTAGLMAQLTGS